MGTRPGVDRVFPLGSVRRVGLIEVVFVVSLETREGECRARTARVRKTLGAETPTHSPPLRGR